MLMREDRIPTMPQADERIPTMPQGEERIPTMPQNDGRVPTVPQAEGRTATVPQGGFAPGAASGGKIITSDCTFVGVRGGRFTLYASQVISADSGESQIYGCTMENAPENYVARVLKSVTPASPFDKLIQREKVLEFLLRYSNRPDSHILPLVDHGKVQQGGNEYFVEIYPFCSGGDLGQRRGAIPYETLCKEIVPAINEALHTFHSAGFVHRDVKPDNLYYYNGQVVLGDFGITCDLVNNNFATDRTKTGTLGYYAPELMSQAAVRASDYYSFGQTLWTLYSGEMMYQNILRRYRSEGIEAQRNQINFAMMQDTYYGLDEIRQEEHFFEILIRGLLQYDVGSRFDYDKVNRWLAEDYSLAHEITKYHDMDTYPVPFKQDGQPLWNNAQLFGALRNDWENAKELLYSGELRSFFQHFNPQLSNEIDQIAKKYAKPSKNRQLDRDTMYDIGVAQLFLLLNKGQCLVWGDVVYNRLSDLGQLPVAATDILRRYKASEEGFLRSGLVVDWYRMCRAARKEKTDEYVLSALMAAQDYVTDTAWDQRNIATELSRAMVQQVFLAMEGKSQFQGCSTLEELILALCAKETGVYGYLQYNLLGNPHFYGFLVAQGYREFADSLLRGQHSDSQLVELLLCFFEQEALTADTRQQVVAFYKNHGPEAYLLWLQNHLELYDFNGEAANALRQQIQALAVEGETVSQVKACYADLLALATQLRTLFVDNIYMAKLGLTAGKEKDGITSTHLIAYWHKQLYGRDVPIGFDIS